MSPTDASRFLHSAERQLAAARRVVSGAVDAAAAREFFAATEAEREAREALLSAAPGLSPRSSSPSRSS